MDLMNITTPSNGEVVTFDFSANKVCGEKIAKDDAMKILQAMGEITHKGSIITGFYLLALKEKADLQELGFANIYDLAKDLFGLSRGVVSERINVAQRFRSEDMSVYALDDKWKDYKYTALLNMRKMTNEEIEAAKITPTTLALEIKEVADKSTKKDETKKEDIKKADDKKEDTKTENNESSDSEPSKHGDDVSRETPDFANIVELAASELPVSLRTALDKYMRAHNIDSHAILQINMDK